MVCKTTCTDVTTCVRGQGNKTKMLRATRAAATAKGPRQAVAVHFHPFCHRITAAECHGYDFICVVADTLSKITHFVQVHSSMTAYKFADLFFRTVWCLHGFPKSIAPDRYPRFITLSGGRSVNG